MKKAKSIDLKKLVALIKPAKNILVSTHTNPDGDGIGSMIAFGIALRKLGKKVTVYSRDSIPKMYHYLPGQEKVVHKLPKRAQFDLSFIIDLGELERVGDEFLNYPGRRTTISLDHHARGVHNADYNYCLPKMASSGEVIFKVIKALKVPLNKSMAANIYTAIVTDTGSFKYSNTTAETFAVASELVSHKIDVWEVALNCFETFSQQRMDLLKKVMATMEVHRNKKVAWVVLKNKDFKATGALPEDAEGFINYPRSIETVEVALAFKELEKNTYKISFRSKKYVDVAAIALKFDGGGHIRASGCKMTGSLELIKKTLLTEIQKQLK